MSSEYEDDFINSYQATSRRSTSKTYHDQGQSQASYTHRTQASSRLNRSEQTNNRSFHSSSSSSSPETSDNSISKENSTINQSPNKQFTSKPSEPTLNGLSSKELKTKLIQVVKNKGILDHMKASFYFDN